MSAAAAAAAAAEEQHGAAPMETLKSLTLTQDSDGSIILHCPADVADSRKSFEVTVTTAAANDTGAREGAAPVQVLCDSDDVAAAPPDGKAEVSAVSQAWFTTKEDKDTLTNKGHKWKQGMWSKEEIDLLISNIEQYVKGRGIDDPAEIIFDMSKEERKDFYRSVALGLNRPLFAVYRRVLRMYDNRNHVGRYTPGEIEKLKGLRDRHGNDWATIGAALGRSASSVKDRCRLLKDTCNTGKWSEEEERRLAQVVYEMAASAPGSAVTGGVSWASVAARVGTRSEKQCRSKWLNYLNWKHSGGTEWTKDDDLGLTRRILELEVADENEIKWEELAGGWSSVRSPQWLRSKWWSIKRQVANHKEIPFPVLLKALHELMSSSQSAGGSSSAAPSLQARLGRSEESGAMAALQIPLQIPLQMAHLDSAVGVGEGETITLNGGTLQAFEILPSFQLQPTGTPGTYFLQSASNQGLPLSLANNSTLTLTAGSSSSAAHEHIILHGLATDGLCAGDGVIIQTVAADAAASDELPVETEGRRQDEHLDASALLGNLEKAATKREEPMTDSFTDKPLTPPPTDAAVLTPGGAVLIVSPPDISGTLTDPILENQDGCD
ncbi:cyclin-D-binding Myb-like transcription factor 1 isoform X2 [Syngnathus acus]|uniref:cyclin-D-binding Myb-like transcription factor 1 isoform X2 n=1 Tax=Syngnathus acus TaxID=161584 RepID=UPI001885CF0E|nr:cyclin-D-binding Myb-like transcription factor 1 isoform X2 [Syngnathus acus]